MGFLSGAVSLTRLQLEDELPEYFSTQFDQQLFKYKYNEKVLESQLDQIHWGWINPRDILNQEWRFEDCILDQDYYGAIRIDKRKFSQLLFKAHLKKSIQEYKKVSKTEKISPFEIEQIKVQLKNQMLIKAPVQTNMLEFVWNLATNHIYISSTAKGDLKLFKTAFLKTFNLGLIESDFVQKYNQFNINL